MCDKGWLVGLCVQDYKSVYSGYDLCHRGCPKIWLVHIEERRQRLPNNPVWPWKVGQSPGTLHPCQVHPGCKVGDNTKYAVRLSSPKKSHCQRKMKMTAKDGIGPKRTSRKITKDCKGLSYNWKGPPGRPHRTPKGPQGHLICHHSSSDVMPERRRCHYHLLYNDRYSHVALLSDLLPQRRRCHLHLLYNDRYSHVALLSDLLPQRRRCHYHLLYNDRYSHVALLSFTSMTACGTAGCRVFS